MSHGDHVDDPPPGFRAVARSANGALAAMAGEGEFAHLLAIQFHPEVHHTPRGADLLRNFLVGVCGCATDWSAESFVEAATRQIRERVGAGRVLLGLSAGVDSAVAAALIHRAVADQL